MSPTKMYRKSIFVLLSVLFIVLNSEVYSADKMILARGATGILYAVEQVAMQKGFFKQESIDFEILSARGAAGTAALLAGEANLAPSLAQLIPAKKQGAPLVAVASAFKQFGILWALSNEAIKQKGVEPNSPIIERIKALRGLKIGISRTGSTVDVLTRALVKVVGMDPDRDLHLIPVGGGASMVAALQRGAVDGYSFVSPFVEEAEFRGIGKTFINLQAGEVEQLDGAPHIIYYTSVKQLNKKREMFVRFTKALARAMSWIHEHPDETRELMVKYLSRMDPKLVRVAWGNALPAIPKDPRINKNGLMKAIELLGDPKTMTYEDLVDKSIAEEALKSIAK